MEIFNDKEILSLIFAGLMGLSMLIYAVLDGYDLGVGMLIPYATEEEKDRMIASIGPFWDANETWLVLGVGILLVAFPLAHGLILSNLYLPVAFMLLGLILRGVSFDFRAKVRAERKSLWNRAFFTGSLIMAISQGYMLGSYIMGFEKSWQVFCFSMLTGLSVAAGFTLNGACWLIAKTEDVLQQKAIRWARLALYGMTVGIGLVSLATPFVSERIFDKWFSIPNIFLLAPIPLVTGLLVLGLAYLLRHMPKMPKDRLCWLPFFMVIGIYVLCFHGMAYSFYPYIVPDQLKIVDASSAVEAMQIILAGVAVVLPVLIGYTVFAYRVFRGKASELSYY